MNRFSNVLKRLEAIEEKTSPLEYHIALVNPYWSWDKPITCIRCEGADMSQEEFRMLVKAFKSNHVFYITRSNAIIDTWRGRDTPTVNLDDIKYENSVREH